MPVSVEEISNPDSDAVRALGRDPFDDLGAVDLLLERLDQLEMNRVRSAEVRPRAPRTSERKGIAVAPSSRGSGARRAKLDPATSKAPKGASVPARAPTIAAASGERALPRAPADRPRAENVSRLTLRRWSTTPPLEEIELPPPKGFIDRLLSADQRRIVAALAHLVEGESRYDRFGYSPDVVKTAFPIFHALYRFYFRVRSEGHQHIPSEGPVVLAGNHAGLLPFDAAMAIIDVALHTNPPRLVRSVVDRWAGSLPWINIFYARVGQVVGTRENFAKLLEEGQLVLVFPEGVAGIRKTIAHRYRLQDFRVGFIEHALRAGVPIVPVAFIGSDDQSPILFNIEPLARRLGIPVAPITPTFPWLGPLGLLPYPVSYRIVYGEPLRYHERFGPEGADDARLVRYLANQVRRAVQLLIDRNRQ